MNNRGFSLTELITVMVIMGTLLAITTMNFSNYTRKAQVERTTRELFADFNTARMDSIYRKTRHSIVMNTNGTGYVLKRYSSADEATAAGTTVFTKPTQYLLTKENGTNFTATDGVFLFDIRGTTTDLNTIRVNPVDSGSGFDCIVIHTARTNIGQMTGGSCVQK